MKNKGYDSLLLIVALPCITFVLAIALLGILEPVVTWLGTSVYNNSTTFPIVPPKPSAEPEVLMPFLFIG